MVPVNYALSISILLYDLAFSHLATAKTVQHICHFNSYCNKLSVEEQLKSVHSFTCMLYCTLDTKTACEIFSSTLWKELADLKQYNHL
jgi:hypothetical protein